MKSIWIPRMFLAAALVFHLVMLWNLNAHFTWTLSFPPAWSPIKTGSSSPAHWAREHPGIGPWRSPSENRFSMKFKAVKQKEINEHGLMAVPPRQTDNFGLDFLVRDSTHTDPGGDFFQLYHSGFDVRWNTSIYENYPEDMDPVLRGILKTVAPFHPPNRYPPGFAYTVGVLLSLFTPWNALLMWILCHEAALVFCLFLTWRLCRLHAGRFPIAAAMWLGFLPWYLELYMGQTTFIIMTGTFVLGAYFLNISSELSAIVWWTATLITKPLTLIYTPLLLWTRRYRLTACGLAVGILSAVAYFIYRPADGRLFISWAFGQEIVASLGNICLQNLVYHFLFSSMAVKVLSYALLLLGIILTLLLGRRAPVRTLCLWVCIYFLSYAHVWQHHMVLLLPACILPYILTGRVRFILPWILLTLPSPFYFFEGHWNWLREIVYLTAGTLPVILLVSMLLIQPSEGEQSGTHP